MIKFNQIVRVSVLSLTLAGGLGLAGHAFAYDALDLSDASSEYYARLNQLQLDQGQLDAAQEAYDDQVDYCTNVQHYQDPGFCINDAEAALGPAIYYWQDTVDADQSLLNDAAAWFSTVYYDQNGMHGVP